jgi:site-specific recombinase XerD
MLKRGAPLHGISAFLGHQDQNMVERYTRVEPLELRACVDKMVL